MCIIYIYICLYYSIILYTGPVTGRKWWCQLRRGQKRSHLFVVFWLELPSDFWTPGGQPLAQWLETQQSFSHYLKCSTLSQASHVNAREPQHVGPSFRTYFTLPCCSFLKNYWPSFSCQPWFLRLASLHRRNSQYLSELPIWALDWYWIPPSVHGRFTVHM